MPFGCPTCPAFPPVIPQVSLHPPSSALLSLALIRFVEHVESCLLGVTVFAEVSALAVSGPWWQPHSPLASCVAHFKLLFSFCRSLLNDSMISS